MRVSSTEEWTEMEMTEAQAAVLNAAAANFVEAATAALTNAVEAQLDGDDEDAIRYVVEAVVETLRDDLTEALELAVVA